ncbi:MAG: hypothetical protein HY619_02705 [Thaumarchaeota archaeon]|nr:hypothetical protein [Nitrososphaerota archaeon]
MNEDKGVASEGSMDRAFKFDLGRGVITGTKTDTRLFMFAALPNSVALAKIFETFKSGAAVMLHVLGKGYGSAVFTTVRKAGSTPQEMISFLVDASRNLGWGRAIVSGDMAKGTELRLEMQDCVICENLWQSGEPRCYFLGGVVQGMLEQIFSDEFSFTELECRSKGDYSCKFVFRRNA